MTRTVFVSIVIVLVASGIVHGASTKERFVAEVTKLGGTVEFAEGTSAKEIVKVDLHGTAISDEDMRLFEAGKKHLKNLRTLDLRLTKIGDRGVAKLGNLTSLRTLNLFRTGLGDEGLADLRKLTKLETLLIGGTKVTDAGLVNLKPFTRLRKLSLFQTQVSDEGVAQLKLLGSLEVLLIGGSKITPAGTELLQKALPRIKFSENT